MRKSSSLQQHPSQRVSPLASIGCLLDTYCFLGVLPASLSEDKCTFEVRKWRHLKVRLGIVLS